MQQSQAHAASQYIHIYVASHKRYLREYPAFQAWLAREILDNLSRTPMLASPRRPTHLPHDKLLPSPLARHDSAV
jgi:hypothetical protein